jgi:hypothetical protein
MALMTVHKVTTLPTAPFVTDALYLLLRDNNKVEMYITDSAGTNLIPLTLASTMQINPFIFTGGSDAS